MEAADGPPSRNYRSRQEGTLTVLRDGELGRVNVTLGVGPGPPAN